MSSSQVLQNEIAEEIADKIADKSEDVEIPILPSDFLSKFKAIIFFFEC